MITKVLKYTVLSLGLTFVLTSCDDLLEPALENQKDLEALEKEALSVQRLVLNAYAALPNYYDNSDYATDDAVTNQKSDSYIKIATGGWTADNGTLSVWPGSYAGIQYVNLFLQIREGQRYVKNETTNALLTRRLLGEAYALRGIHLYFLLRNHAGFVGENLLGVQLFDEALDINSNFNVSRSTFAECVNKALADFNEAVKYLPFDYNDVKNDAEVPAKFRDITTDASIYNLVMGNKARQLVNTQIIESFRSRLLLLAASPAFLNSGWDKAADAAATVIDELGGVAALPADGITYYDGNNVSDATLAEGANPKEILWRGNKETHSANSNAGYKQESDNYPPSLFGNGMMNPTQNLVDAFPAANGFPISDVRSGYDAQHPYVNRDPRLDTYIIHDGSTAGVNSTVIRTGSKSGSNDGIDKVESKSTRTGYYMKKRLRMSVNCDPSSTSGQNHITPRIRLTEIFLNYAEAANEAWGPTGKGSHNYSAYDIIKAIRQRAGITDTQYLDECAGNKDLMRQLIRNERRLELCFESFRFWDLRRWKANLTETARGLDVNEDVQGNFTFEKFDVENRSYQSYQNYGPIPQSETLKYNNLQQNDGWK